MEKIIITTPSELEYLIESILKKVLICKSLDRPSQTVDQWFDLDQLCEYLPDKPAKATVYSWIQHHSIPSHKGTKKLRFLKSEIDSWLKEGYKSTISDIEAEADAFLSNTKRKGGKHA